MVRAPFFDRNGMKKGAWSEEEDNKLRAFVFTHGHSNWRLLPKYAGLARCGKSCRLRWVNYLRPGVKRGNFTKQEEDLIIQLHALFGNKWSIIATYLEGRTDNDIKNFWNAHIQKRRKRNPDAKNQLVKCQTSEAYKAKEENLSSASTLVKLQEPTVSFDATFSQAGVDLWPADNHMFLGNEGHEKDHCLPPLIEEAGFFYDVHQYRELSCSQSSMFKWDRDGDHNIMSSEYHVDQGSVLSECLALDTSNGSFFDPFFDQYCFSYGTLN